MIESTTIREESSPVLETWRRFYNGPNEGMIDIASAKRDAPWLVGEEPAVTLRFEGREPESCDTVRPENHRVP
jgi:hypothetical protein